MDINKLIQVTAYVINKYYGRLNYTKLIKELYLSDRKSFDLYGVSITGDVYYSLPNGPILSELYDYIRNRGESLNQTLWNCRFITVGNDISLTSNYYFSNLLSESEMKILDEVDNQFHSSSYGEMIDFVHDKNNCPEWENPFGSSKPIFVRTILEKLNKTSDEIDFILSEDEIYKKEDEVFAKLGKIDA